MPAIQEAGESSTTVQVMSPSGGNGEGKRGDDCEYYHRKLGARTVLIITLLLTNAVLLSGLALSSERRVHYHRFMAETEHYLDSLDSRLVRIEHSHGKEDS